MLPLPESKQNEMQPKIKNDRWNAPFLMNFLNPIDALWIHDNWQDARTEQNSAAQYSTVHLY